MNKNLFQNLQTEKSLKTNLLLMLTGEGILKLFQFIINAFIARKLGPTGFGLFNDVFSQAELIGVLADFGISVVVVRNIANKSLTTKDALEKYLPYKIVLVVISTLLFLFIGVWDKDASLWLYLSLGLFKVLQTGYLSFIYGLSRGDNHFIKENITKILNVLAMMVGLSIFFTIPTINNASIPYLLSVLAPSLLLTIYWLKKYPGLKLNLDFSKLKSLLHELWKPALTAASVVLYSVMPIQYLQFVSTHEDVGYYAAASKFILPLLLLSSILNTVLLPHLSRSKGSLNYKRNRVLIFLIIIVVFVLTGIIFAPFLTEVLYGSQFANSVIALQIMVIVPVLHSFNLFFGNMLLSKHMESQYLTTSIFPVLLFIPIALVTQIFIKSHIAVAAIAVVIMYLLGTILRWKAIYLAEK